MSKVWFFLIIAGISPAALADMVWNGQLDGSYASADRGRSWVDAGTNVQGAGERPQLNGFVGLSYQNEDSPWRAQIKGRALFANESTGRSLGLSEAFVDYGRLEQEGYRWRVGFAFAGTSFENVEDFWQSPYTLSFSALNSWIAEEFRPLGLDWTGRWQGEQSNTDLSIAAFRGNDTGPAMLAWRGFALHSRISVLGETLALPPLTSLDAANQFTSQRDKGTQPFGPDLDGRTGYAVRVRHARTDGPRFSAYFADNRGDQDLHDGDEYAWANRFAVVGGEWHIGNDWTVLAESMFGSTDMGFPPGANVQFDYQAHYVLLSRSFERHVISTRLDHFEINERDFSIAENNRQRGDAITLAWLYNADVWRFGLEYQWANVRRPGNATDFATARAIDIGGNRVQFSARRYF